MLDAVHVSFDNRDASGRHLYCSHIALYSICALRRYNPTRFAVLFPSHPRTMDLLYIRHLVFFLSSDVPLLPRIDLRSQQFRPGVMPTWVGKDNP
ncbi:uncharacterized protein EKO05_0008771 [Ascochyta rabiei]|uniref:uncharacterized protein n=1 Tax=Didymella rabiei TaxID=5454 RepID=UPI0021FE8036|nr:uncharacterized protein EKO05_0008771 [Ascochyta rabiei]UPX18472.1 hypothetical protein EKO05_0008771 [Ascochyta rabiei]